MTEYRGPYDISEEIAKFIIEDAKPSVRLIKSLASMKKTLQGQVSTAVIGFFSAEDLVDEEVGESYSVKPWGQFQAAADSMRGYVEIAVILALI